MFRALERVLKPTEPPAQPEPPAGLTAFYWHFARQAKGLLAALFVAGFVVALLDSTIPVFVGRIVSLLTASAPDRLSPTTGTCSSSWPWCSWWHGRSR
jgi:ATP-binding cassette subfamily B multidrug efflux pump